jgi:hypothetical protein
MRLEVREKNEETGDIEFAGILNAKEVSFLVQYAINDLMGKGFLFDLKGADLGELRLKVPDGETIQ